MPYIDTSRSMGFGGAQVVNHSSANDAAGYNGYKSGLSKANQANFGMGKPSNTSFMGSKLPAASSAGSSFGSSTGGGAKTGGGFAVNQKLHDTYTNNLQSMMDKPGLDDRTQNAMINKGNDEIAEREAQTKLQLQQSAASMGAGFGGGVQQGLRQVSSDFGGQRANNARDVRTSVEQDRLNRKENAVGMAGSYLGKVSDRDQQAQQFQASQNMQRDAMLASQSNADRQFQMQQDQMNRANQLADQQRNAQRRQTGGPDAGVWQNPGVPTQQLGGPGGQQQPQQQQQQPQGQDPNEMVWDSRTKQMMPYSQAMGGRGASFGGSDVRGMPAATGSGFGASVGFQAQPSTSSGGTINGQPVAQRTSGITSPDAGGSWLSNMWSGFGSGFGPGVSSPTGGYANYNFQPVPRSPFEE